MAGRRVVIETVGQTYDLELTEALETTMSNIGAGFTLSSPWIQIHDEEWLNLERVISFQFKGNRSTRSADSSGRVYEGKSPEVPWQPDQHGGVITAEPEMVERARMAGEQVTDKPDSGDMV